MDGRSLRGATVLGATRRMTGKSTTLEEEKEDTMKPEGDGVVVGK